jgi:hypothetical protein
MVSIDEIRIQEIDQLLSELEIETKKINQEYQSIISGESQKKLQEQRQQLMEKLKITLLSHEKLTLLNQIDAIENKLKNMRKDCETQRNIIESKKTALKYEKNEIQKKMLQEKIDALQTAEYVEEELKTVKTDLSGKNRQNTQTNSQEKGRVFVSSGKDLSLEIKQDIRKDESVVPKTEIPKPVVPKPVVPKPVVPKPVVPKPEDLSNITLKIPENLLTPISKIAIKKYKADNSINRSKVLLDALNFYLKLYLKYESTFIDANNKQSRFKQNIMEKVHQSFTELQQEIGNEFIDLEKSIKETIEENINDFFN